MILYHVIILHKYIWKTDLWSQKDASSMVNPEIDVLGSYTWLLIIPSTGGSIPEIFLMRAVLTLRLLKQCSG
jgi:hypothetical protein